MISPNAATPAAALFAGAARQRADEESRVVRAALRCCGGAPGGSGGAALSQSCSAPRAGPRPAHAVAAVERRDVLRRATASVTAHAVPLLLRRGGEDLANRAEALEELANF